jgi:hypothetical protein
MPENAVRSDKTDMPYESRAKTEAAVERIHETFKRTKQAIAEEKAGEPSGAANSRVQPESELVREALQLSLEALTEARDSLDAALKTVCTSIDTVKQAKARSS